MKTARRKKVRGKGRALRTLPPAGVIEEVETTKLEEDEEGNRGVELGSSFRTTSIAQEAPAVYRSIIAGLEALKPLVGRYEYYKIKEKLEEAQMWCERRFGTLAN